MARTKAPANAKKEKVLTPIEVSGGRSHDEMMMVDEILDYSKHILIGKLPLEGMRRRVKRLLCDEFLCDKSFVLIKSLVRDLIEEYVPEDEKALQNKRIGEAVNNAHTNDLRTRQEMLEYEWYNKND